MDKEDLQQQFNDIRAKVSELYLRQHRQHLIQHQIQSYNLFCDKLIDDVIQGFNPINVMFNYDVLIKDFKQKVIIRISNPVFQQPKIRELQGQQTLLTPQLCRLRQCTYQSFLKCDYNIVQYQYNEEKKDYDIITQNFYQQPFCKIPIMVMSKYCTLSQLNIIDNNECPYDVGGYFIISGSEKVIISQDRISENRIFVFKNNKTSQSFELYAEVRSCSQQNYSSAKLFKLILYSKKNEKGFYIRCQIQNIKFDIPLFVLFRALNINSDKKIMEYCDFRLKKYLIGSASDGNYVLQNPNALSVLEKHMQVPGYSPKEYQQNPKLKRQLLNDILKSEFLPHIEGGQAQKAIFLGQMVQKLIKTKILNLDVDDRDSYYNKKIDTAGYSFAALFRQAFNKFKKEVKSNVIKELKQPRAEGVCVVNNRSLETIFRPSQIESALKFSLATGFWNTKSAATQSRQGVAQVISRLSYLCTYSYLRRLNTPMEKNDKIIQPRMNHPTQFFYMCPNESPEGSPIGLVKHFALSCEISNNNYFRLLINTLELLNKRNIINLDLICYDNMEQYFKTPKIVINGQYTFYVKATDFQKTYKLLTEFKRTSLLHIHTSISIDYDDSLIIINVEPGRPTRPLFIKKALTRLLDGNDINGQKLKEDILNSNIKNFSELIHNKYFPLIEYVDILQSNSCKIHMDFNDFLKKQKDQNEDFGIEYQEIDPQFMLGIMGSINIFSNHNPSPRNAYVASMAKQAIGVYNTRYYQRFDTTANVINYKQLPLIKTHIQDHINLDKLPYGQNLLIAIMCYSGFNQEDAIIMNQGAIDRGLFRHTQYKTYKETNIGNLSTGETEEFMQITDNKEKSYNYSKVNRDGFVDVDSYVTSGDVIMAKKLIQRTQNAPKQQDTSVAVKNNDSGFIDCNIYNNNNKFTTKNPEGYDIPKTRIRQSKVPKEGDKFASSHAQKGLIGSIRKETEMPFTKDGYVPDIIFNPNGIPSRMTVGQILEMLMGPICLQMGTRGYADTFNSMPIEKIQQLLTKHGMNSNGNDILYSGITGEQINTPIFMGTAYYMRLKHLVDNKIHSRSLQGPVTVINRQPSEGRQKAGGLKVGYMEDDCQISYGAFQFLREKLFECSDIFQISICNQCKTNAIYNFKEKKLICKVCKFSQDFSIIFLPYASKLFMQELLQMSIVMQLHTKSIGSKKIIQSIKEDYLQYQQPQKEKILKIKQ